MNWMKQLVFGIPVVGPIIALVPDFVWQGLAIFVVLSGIYLAGDIHGANKEKAKCRAAAERAQVLANKQDQSARDLTTADDKSVTADLISSEEADKRVRDAVDQAITKQRAEAPKPNCPPVRRGLSRDELKLLRD